MNPADLIKQIKERFNLHHDAAPYEQIYQEIESNIEFKGANLWILTFAILMASIGLNLNSTAIVIGAMLISPLMGPILGLGLGIAVYDFDLVRRSLKSLGFAVATSLASSFLYFLLTPLSDAKTELLARTTPTIWDVFIALFGGLAGMIGTTRRTRGNVIAGVAIATAIMPPLCTAGFGLATGSPQYFLGALYLFFINGVFICLGTWLVARLMHFPLFRFVDEATRLKVRYAIFAFTLITAIPSVYLGYQIVDREIVEVNVRKFLSRELGNLQNQIISTRIDHSAKPTRIELSLLGKVPNSDEQNAINSRLRPYGLDNTLVVFNGVGTVSDSDMVALKANVIEELYKKNNESIRDREIRIAELESKLERLEKDEIPSSELLQEARALFPQVAEILAARVEGDSSAEGPIVIAVFMIDGKILSKDRERIERWIQTRTRAARVLASYRPKSKKT